MPLLCQGHRANAVASSAEDRPPSDQKYYPDIKPSSKTSPMSQFHFFHIFPFAFALPRGGVTGRPWFNPP